MSTIGKAIAIVLVAFIAMPIGNSLVASEQLDRLPRIGVLWPGLVDQWVKAFEEGLREHGYIHGATAVVYVRATGANYESGPRFADELIALNPDVIYAVPAVLVRNVVDAEQRAGKQIPIVLLTYDPVAEGLLSNAAHPDANMTGVAGVPAPGDLLTKHLQLLKELLPRLKRVAYLTDTTWYKDLTAQTKAALEKVGPTIGVQVTSIDVRGPDDLERALSDVVQKHLEAMIVSPVATSLANRSRIISFASKHRLPTAYWEEVFADEGGLMSYGFSVAERYRSAAGIVAKVLRGTKPADIPVDYSMRFRLVVNLKTARALRLRVPQSVLIQASEVIR